MPTTFDKLMLQKSDFLNYRDISQNLDDSRLNPYIFEAQIGPLTQLIGRALYTAMQEDYTPNIPIDEGTFTESRFDDLWFGITYISNIDENREVIFRGLKPATIYWAYRRLEHNQPINITRFGTRKLADTDFSVDTTTYSHEVAAGSEALQYQSEAIDFLNQFRDIYPEWQHEGLRERSAFKFYKV